MKIIAALVVVSLMQTPTSPVVHVVSREAMSGVDESKQAIARTASEWASLWRQHAGDKALPAVDFDTRMVVAVFLGSRPSGGYAAEITAVREANGALIVAWQERRPEKGAMTAQVLTSPAIIATVRKFAGEIKFEQVQR